MKLKHIYLMTRKKNGKRGVNRDKEECRKCIKTLKKEIKKNPLRFQDFSIERHGEKSTLFDMYGHEIAEFNTRLTNISKCLKKNGVTVTECEERVTCAFF